MATWHAQDEPEEPAQTDKYLITVPTRKYYFTAFEDNLGQIYHDQAVELPSLQRYIEVERTPVYQSVRVVAPPCTMYLQPPEGERYAPYRVLCPARYHQYWPPLQEGQDVPEDKEAFAFNTAPVDDPGRLVFTNFGTKLDNPPPSRAMVEENVNKTYPGTLHTPLCHDDPGKVTYGFRQGSAGSMQFGGERIGYGLSDPKDFSGVITPQVETPEPPMIEVPEEMVGEPRSLPLRDRDVVRLDRLIRQNPSDTDGETLYANYFDEESQERFTPAEYMTRFGGNHGVGSNGERGEWYLAFVPPHRWLGPPVVDATGTLHGRRMFEFDFTRFVRIFVPETVLSDPVYRPHTFRVQGAPQLLVGPTAATDAVIVHQPDVWARFWQPARLGQVVIRPWWGNILVPESGRLELVSANEPPELIVVNGQPGYGPAPPPTPDSVPPPPMANFNDPANGPIAPSVGHGRRVEGTHGEAGHTTYLVNFKPVLIEHKGYSIDGQKYPNQQVAINYQPTTFTVKDDAEGVKKGYRELPLSPDAVVAPIRGRFEKSQQPVGADGQKIKSLPDTTITVQGHVYLYSWVPTIPSLLAMMRPEALQTLMEMNQFNRTRLMKTPDKRERVYEAGVEEKIFSRDWVWYRIWFPPYGVVIDGDFHDRSGRTFPGLPRQRVVIEPVPLLQRFPVTKCYLPWTVEPVDMKIILYTSGAGDTDVFDFTPDKYDFYPPLQGGQRYSSRIHATISRLRAPKRVIRNPGRGSVTIPDVRTADVEEDVGMLGPLEEGELETVEPELRMRHDAKYGPEIFPGPAPPLPHSPVDVRKASGLPRAPVGRSRSPSPEQFPIPPGGRSRQESSPSSPRRSQAPTARPPPPPRPPRRNSIPAPSTSPPSFRPRPAPLVPLSGPVPTKPPRGAPTKAPRGPPPGPPPPRSPPQPPKPPQRPGPSFGAISPPRTSQSPPKGPGSGTLSRSTYQELHHDSSSSDDEVVEEFERSQSTSPRPSRRRRSSSRSRRSRSADK